MRAPGGRAAPLAWAAALALVACVPPLSTRGGIACGAGDACPRGFECRAAVCCPAGASRAECPAVPHDTGPEASGEDARDDDAPTTCDPDAGTGCGPDQECRAGTCCPNTAGAECPSPSIGSPCATNAECARLAPNALCLRRATGGEEIFPRGYCTVPCVLAPGSCGALGECLSIPSIGGALCVRRCTVGGAPCRADQPAGESGYSCAPRAGSVEGVCLPDCTQGAPCVSGTRCVSYYRACLRECDPLNPMCAAGTTCSMRDRTCYPSCGLDAGAPCPAGSTCLGVPTQSSCHPPR